MADKKKEALGKGIRALLENMDSEVHSEDDSNPTPPQGSEASNLSVVNIPLEYIEVNPFQPRADFNEESLNELAASIKVHGIIQPVTVRALNNKRFQLIAGERRVRAAKIAGLTEVPAYLRKANDQEMLEIGLIENIQREDLNAIEIAINYKRLIDECDLRQEEMADRVGKNRSTVTNYLRLLKLPPDIQLGIKTQKISMGHARALIGIDDVLTQLSLFKEILEKGLSVRKVEEWVRNLSKTNIGQSPKKIETISFVTRRVEDDLKSHLGTKVSVKAKSGGRGEIVISYFSDDDLNRILELINNSNK